MKRHKEESRELHFKFEKNLTPFELDFLEYHRIRLNNLLKFLSYMVNTKKRECPHLKRIKVLNIGLSVFDLIVKEKLSSFENLDYYVAIPSLNFGKANDYDGINLIKLDICNFGQEILEYNEVFDLIIFSGVLEHLFCSDRIVFENLHKLLRKGGLMFLAVPNSTSFLNRLKLLIGRNVHWTKEDILGGTEFGGYGHIREYTKYELIDLVSPKFEIVKFLSINDYKVRGINFSYFNKLIPVSWAIDIGIILKK
ncbi:MAG: class I SAM-dependent methyltransferase [Caldisphaera sp.]